MRRPEYFLLDGMQLTQAQRWTGRSTEGFAGRFRAARIGSHTRTACVQAALPHGLQELMISFEPYLLPLDALKKLCKLNTALDPWRFALCLQEGDRLRLPPADRPLVTGLRPNVIRFLASMVLMVDRFRTRCCYGELSSRFPCCCLTIAWSASRAPPTGPSASLFVRFCVGLAWGRADCLVYVASADLAPSQGWWSSTTACRSQRSWRCTLAG